MSGRLATMRWASKRSEDFSSLGEGERRAAQSEGVAEGGGSGSKGRAKGRHRRGRAVVCFCSSDGDGGGGGVASMAVWRARIRRLAKRVEALLDGRRPRLGDGGGGGCIDGDDGVEEGEGQAPSHARRPCCTWEGISNGADVSRGRRMAEGVSGGKGPMAACTVREVEVAASCDERRGGSSPSEGGAGMARVTGTETVWEEMVNASEGAWGIAQLLRRLDQIQWGRTEEGGDTWASPWRVECR